MTSTANQQALVAAQFGPRAEAYVTSAVHAQGEDLNRIAGWAAARRPARALDLGCGGGHVAFALSPHAGEVIAYDLSPDKQRLTVNPLTGDEVAKIVQETVNASPAVVARAKKAMGAGE